MNTVNYFLVAKSVVRGEEGSITIVNVFNRLAVDKVPVANPPVTLAFGFFPPAGMEEDKEIKIKLQVISPNNETLAELDATAKRKGPTDGKEHEITSFVDLSDGLQLPTLGTYTIRLLCADKLLAENKFEVVKKEVAKK